MSRPAGQALTPSEAARKVSGAIAKLVVLIVVFIVVDAVVKWLFNAVLVSLYSKIPSYFPYANAMIVLLFGWYIVSAFADVIFWMTYAKYDYSAAAGIRNAVRIMGLGALIAAVVASVVGGLGGLTIGGFIGIVVGFAVQQVLSQAVAGLFLLFSRPFKITDYISVTGEQGVVEDIGAMFTKIHKDDGTVVLVPSSTIIGNKIYFPPRPQQQQQKQ